MAIDSRTSSRIQSIERAVAIMRCFSEQQPELGVTEISRCTSLHKSTVSRILSTLQKEGFISQNSNTGKYRLGVGLISLAGVALGRIDVRAAAYDHLDTLVEQTKEGVSVSVLDGVEAVIVLHKPSPNPVRYVNWIGRRLPLHCTSSGKVLLAGLAPEPRAAILDRSIQRYTANTVFSRADLLEELPVISSRGFAIALEEHERGTNSIAAPVCNHEGGVVGAISISGPAFRLPEDVLRGHMNPLLATAAHVSAELGHVPAASNVWGVNLPERTRGG